MSSKQLHAVIVEDEKQHVSMLSDALKHVRRPSVNVVWTLSPDENSTLPAVRREFREKIEELRDEDRLDVIFLDILLKDAPRCPWGLNLAEVAREVVPDAARIVYTKLERQDNEIKEAARQHLLHGIVYKSDVINGEADRRQADGSTPLGNTILEAIEKSKAVSPRTTGDILRIIDNFKELASYAHQECGVCIEDEASLRKFIYLLLRACFDDVDEESPLGRRGLKSTRIDLMIGDISTMIELKYVRRSGDAKAIQDQIGADAAHYCDREGVSRTLFLLFDPDNAITNRRALVSFVDELSPTFRAFFL